MSNGKVASIVLATAALGWILLHASLVPIALAPVIGWRNHHWLELGAEGAVLLTIAGWILVPRLGDGRWHETPALWTMAMILLVALAVATSRPLVPAAPDPSLQETYYVVVHYHYVTRMGAVFCLFAGFYALFPTVTGYRYNAWFADIQLLLTTIGVSTAVYASSVFFLFNPLPKRFADYPEVFAQANRISTIGAIVAGLGMLMFFATLIEALWRRRPAFPPRI